MLNQKVKNQACGPRQIGRGVLHYRYEPGDMLWSLGDNHAELGQMATQCIDCLRPLADKQITRTKYDCRSLRLFALEGDKPHGRALRSFGDRFSIGHVILLPPHERFHISGCDQFDRVAELADLTASNDCRRRLP